MAATLRLLSLLALLMMPFGMAAAPAAPTAGHHSESMPMEGCREAPAQDGADGSMSDCAMPCSAALPAADLAPAGLEPMIAAMTEPRVDRKLMGVLTEIATPPPKFS